MVKRKYDQSDVFFEAGIKSKIIERFNVSNCLSLFNTDESDS